jgi:hypothetical protein
MQASPAISFYLPKEYTPTAEWLAAWKKKEPLPMELEGLKATGQCWITQTWLQLQAAGKEYHFTTSIPYEGIMIAVGGTLGSHFQPSSSLFLVDITTDGLPHPHAHFHLIQNRAHSKRFTTSSKSWKLPGAFLPLWAQPSLIPRDRERGPHIQELSYFGHSENLDPKLLTKSWQQKLHQLGVHLTVIPPEKWHDYSSTDLVLATRPFHKKKLSSPGYLQKPATKLYNAWLAGVPAIVGQESAFLAEGTAGEDFLLANSPEEILTKIAKLQENQNLYQLMIKRGQQKARSFTATAITQKWTYLLEEILPQKAREHFQQPILVQRAKEQLHQWGCWVDRVWR